MVTAFARCCHGDARWGAQRACPWYHVVPADEQLLFVRGQFSCRRARRVRGSSPAPHSSPTGSACLAEQSSAIGCMGQRARSWLRASDWKTGFVATRSGARVAPAPMGGALAVVTSLEEVVCSGSLL